MDEKLRHYFSENINKKAKNPQHTSHSLEKLEEFSKISINNFQGSTATCK